MSSAAFSQAVGMTMFRRPQYLNVEMLVDLADWADIDLPDGMDVEQTHRKQRGGGLGVSKLLDANIGGSREDETTVRFTEQLRPVQAFNSVLDSVTSEGSIVDLTAETDAAIHRDSVVLVEGELQISPLTDLGRLMGAAMPSFSDAVARGEEPQMDEAALARALFSGEDADLGPLVMDLDPMEASGDTALRTYLVIGDSRWVVDSTDELMDELRVLARVKRLVREGDSRSLDRYLLPGMSRPFRRAMRGDSLEELIRGSEDILGKKIEDPTAILNLQGPAAILEPIAIF